MRRAFTLIELLIVISIIALLIAILLPSLSAARRSAINITCGNNLHQIGIAYATYGVDNDGDYPDGQPSSRWAFGHFEKDTNGSQDTANYEMHSIINLWQNDLLVPETLYCPYETFFDKNTFWRVEDNPMGTHIGYMALAKYKPFEYPQAEEQLAWDMDDDSDTLLAADISVRTAGASDPYLWYSHRLGSKGLGGFSLYNDGSTYFRSDQDLVYRFTKASKEFYW